MVHFEALLGEKLEVMPAASRASPPIALEDPEPQLAPLGRRASPAGEVRIVSTLRLELALVLVAPASAGERIVRTASSIGESSHARSGGLHGETPGRGERAGRFTMGGF